MSAPDTLVAGRYRLIRRIGTGGMGVVWQARDERLDRTVAVKELQPRADLSPADAELANQRAMREARITARLEHPYAVSVFDVVDHEGQTCLVMQYVPSQPLSRLIRRLSVLSPEETARIGRQVGSALAAAHQLGIVHRDVKPANVLIADDGTARISDFGISHALGDPSLTAPGLVPGTPAFLAPEVARGGGYGFASDVYGLGATLYAAVEGAPPFGTDPNPLALVRKVASGRFTPPARSGRLTPLLLRMLASDPGDRPPMGLVAQRLAELGDHDVQAVHTLPPHPATAAVSTDEGPAVEQAGRDSASVRAAHPGWPEPPAQPPELKTPPALPARRPRRRLLAGAGVLALLAVVALVGVLVPGLSTGEDAAGAPESPAVARYASSRFAVPFEVAAPTWLAPQPKVDEPGLVTWQTPDVAIRFLVPVVVYPPDGEGAVPPPADYLTYLLSQSVRGARFSDRVLTTVDGRPATLVTATAERRLAGSIGCPEPGMAAKRCYGLRPERRLRLAVVDRDGRPLLIWLRNDRPDRFAEERALFEQTLATVRFR